MSSRCPCRSDLCGFERWWNIKRQPIVIASKSYFYQPRVLVGYLSVELSKGWWLSRKTWSALSREVFQGELYRTDFGALRSTGL
jgi:hypothetical protein